MRDSIYKQNDIIVNKKELYLQGTMGKTENAQYFLDLIRKSKRGKFKIYIGMIAGVGKTYRMLQEAHELIRNGIDIRIGYIETHDRADTIRLLKGIPAIPLKKIFYKGKEFEEMNMEAIIQSHPEIVIVDELAHSNMNGCHNEKRWQDVVDLLDAGIHVISAVNIQHIESLNEEIKSIVSVEVAERIPDSIIQMADEVVNIDLTAEDLITRLKQGKIYKKEKIEIALQNFFTAEHILRLRELALKEVALKVANKVDIEVNHNLPLCQEHYLGCITSDEKQSRSVIRRVARLSMRVNAKFTILYVRTPKESHDKITLAAQRHLINNFNLAIDLGGDVLQYEARNIVEGIIKVCNDNRFTTVCIGKPRMHWTDMLLTTFRHRFLFKALAEDKVDLMILS